jgi:ABC-type sugar transport system ATPase subunit
MAETTLRIIAGLELPTLGRVMLGGEDVTFRRASAREFRHLMCGELRALHERLGATTVYVTHDQTEAMTLADRVGVVEHGRLVQIGSPREIYVNPANIYIATRLGSPTINLLPRQLVPDLAAPAMAATVGARTEHVRISKPRATTAWAL